MAKQQTISKPVSLKGVGIHTGNEGNADGDIVHVDPLDGKLQRYYPWYASVLVHVKQPHGFEEGNYEGEWKDVFRSIARILKQLMMM